ncbi:MAG TPA: T9SS type A sorting domain-containing protein, partial [Bacteroidales bacterium]|nr:T9SS type A sorting domain-containing protein [Bacteroidales bacterium]
QGQWVSYNIPLSDFTGLTTKQHLAQYILVGQPTGVNTVFIDNFYFYSASTATFPPAAAPTPTFPASGVISLYSDAYTNVPVDTWLTSWSAAQLQDTNVAGNAIKKYSQLDFAGIETVLNQLNVSAMTHLHMDVWSPNFTFFGIKLVDFGADGAYGGGDDVEHQVNFTSPSQGQWVSYDIPLTDFTGLVTKQHLAQYILVGQPTGLSTVFLDNVYFYDIAVGLPEGHAGMDAAISVYPNPVVSGQPVKIGGPVRSSEVLDMTGRILWTGSTSSIPTEGLERGMYLVRVLSPDQRVSTVKLRVD